MKQYIDPIKCGLMNPSLVVNELYGDGYQSDTTVLTSADNIFLVQSTRVKGSITDLEMCRCPCRCRRPFLEKGPHANTGITFEVLPF